MLGHVLFAVAAVIIVILAILVAMALHSGAGGSREAASPFPSGGADEPARSLVADLKIFFREPYLKSSTQRDLARFLSKTCSIETEDFIRILQKANTDRELYEELKKRCRKPEAKEEEKKGRAEARIKDIKKWLGRLEGKTVYYLDVGTSEGDITAAIVEYLRLPKARAFGIDIVAAPEGDKEYTSFVYDGVNLPWESTEGKKAAPGGGFDLVTMFMSAHHFEKPDATIESVKKVMKPGALLIVREHNVEPHEQEEEIFLDFVHYIYAVVLKGEMTVEEFSKAYADVKVAEYRPVKEWKALFEKHGFRTLDFWKTRDKFFSCYLVLEAMQGAPRPAAAIR